jgi:phosphatidylglycerophosphate synthase
MFVSFAFATTNWQISAAAYVGAFFGDVIDGHVARALNQCA